MPRVFEVPDSRVHIRLRAIFDPTGKNMRTDPFRDDFPEHVSLDLFVRFEFFDFSSHATSSGHPRPSIFSALAQHVSPANRNFTGQLHPQPRRGSSIRHLRVGRW
jgi:hypothetical protein